MCSFNSTLFIPAVHFFYFSFYRKRFIFIHTNDLEEVVPQAYFFHIPCITSLSFTIALKALPNLLPCCILLKSSVLSAIIFQIIFLSLALYSGFECYKAPPVSGYTASGKLPSARLYHCQWTGVMSRQGLFHSKRVLHFLTPV